MLAEPCSRGRMGSQALHSLLAVCCGDTGLQRQPFGSLQPGSLHMHPAVMAAEQNTLYQPMNPSERQAEAAVVKVAQLRLQPVPRTSAAGGTAPACPAGSVSIVPREKASARSAPCGRTGSGGGVSRVPQQRQQCGWINHAQAMRRKQMLPPT